MNQQVVKKIKTAKQLVKVVEQQKKKGKRVVLCHGVFDIIHLGHIRHFNLAKKEGDVLIVSITRDKHVKRGPGRPVFNENLRAETLASLEITDYVSIVDSPTAIDFIKTIKPDVYVKGAEYRAKDKDVTGKIYDEEKAIQSVGGRLAFTDDITFSASKIINHHLDVFPPRTYRYLKALSKRYPLDEIVEQLNALKDLKVLVIGDAIIDEYRYCTPMGKSSKEHLVANRYHSREMFAGGALATANNVANVCSRVDLLTLLGAKKSFQDFIEKRLENNIKPFFYSRPDTETTRKRRYVTQNKNVKLFEICFMDDKDVGKREESKIAKRLEKILPQYDLVIVSDFGHGLLTERLRRIICEKSKYLALNVQTNSANTGFNLVTKYPRADCVCIDELELRFAAHDKFGEVRSLVKKIYQQVGCRHIIATRGSFGSVSYSEKEGYHETPAFSYRVVDAIGAGDAFFAFISPCFASGMPQELVSFVGNAVGSLAVQIVCNREPIKFDILVKFITRLLK